MKTRMLQRMLRFCAVLAAALSAGAAFAQAPTLTTYTGNLPDGQPYKIVIPSNWNGTLINDLDFAFPVLGEQGYYQWLHEHGYAGSGITRIHPQTPGGFFDHVRQINNQVRVLDLVEQLAGKPKRIIQLGFSGGGLQAAGMAELFPDRIDGAVAACPQLGTVMYFNTALDTLFAFKALLAPADDSLRLQNLPLSATEVAALRAAWTAAIDTAQQTPQGRARIALAATIGQRPSWLGSSNPPLQPNPKDLVAFQGSLHRAMQIAAGFHAGSLGGYEAPWGGRITWNIGVDYKELFRRGDPDQKRIVHKLYKQAGLDLHADLDLIDNTPRLAADAVTLAFGSVRPRTLAANPAVPLLHIHTVGDEGALPAAAQSYRALVRKNGRKPLYRLAYVAAMGHCTFTSAEIVAAVLTLEQRLITGRWENSAKPRALNAFASELGLGAARFTDGFNPGRLNRAFWNGDAYPGNWEYCEEDNALDDSNE